MLVRSTLISMGSSEASITLASPQGFETGFKGQRGGCLISGQHVLGHVFQGHNPGEHVPKAAGRLELFF